MKKKRPEDSSNSVAAPKAKKTKDELLKSFVKKGKGAANSLPSPKEVEEKLHQLSKATDGEQDYKLTPKGILWTELDKAFSIGGDLKKFETFVQQLLKRLSLLASGNENPALLGKDFNDFFLLFVKSLNLAGKLKEVLDENGIEFDVEEYFKGLEGDE